MIDYCYKCLSKDNLSCKKNRKDGTKLFICKPCRLIEYHATKVKKSHPAKWSDKLSGTGKVFKRGFLNSIYTPYWKGSPTAEYAKMAQDSYTRLSNR